SLTGLEANHFTLVANTLAFVRLGRAHLAHACGGFTHQHLIVATDHNLAAFGSGIADARWRLELDRVGVANVQDQVLAFDLGAIAHTLYFENFIEALAGAGNHVAHHSTRGAMDAAAELFIVHALDQQVGAILLE